MKKSNPVKQTIHVDFCVIGGGVAGIFAAVSAARRGVKTCLVHDRPVLGGNASSEIRMWIRGASMRSPEYREGGLLEELALKNMYYNPMMDYPVWDALLYDMVSREKNIIALLNASCIDAAQEDSKILSIQAWQLTTYILYTVNANTFADCSGDCILSQFIDAAFRHGREDGKEFSESLAPKKADKKTMGNSCLLQARETGFPVKYTAPPFAKKYSEKDMEKRLGTERRESWALSNFWWLEMGGSEDTIRDSEKIRDRLIPAVYGVWDYIKNSGRFNSENWTLDWVGFLPGKRESRRYVGAYILNQNDVERGREFPDEIAYGGWPMDDHEPCGFETRDRPQLAFVDVEPYAIPFRCLYSKNIKNLMFAGRNISVTHIALSSTRVMGTCGLLGQAVGEAAYLCKKYAIAPDSVAEEHIVELQQNLREADCHLLHTRDTVCEPAEMRLSCGEDVSNLSYADERQFGSRGKSFEIDLNDEIQIKPSNKGNGRRLRMIFDSDFLRASFADDYKDEKHFPSRAHLRLAPHRVSVPQTLVKEFEVYGYAEGKWQSLYREDNHCKRLFILPLPDHCTEFKIKFYGTWGYPKARVFSVKLLSC
jgi:hypothetical protein